MVNYRLTKARIAWRMRASDRHGFTLIELSIVLVIIGLIVGGILVGRDLIRVAELHKTVRQVERFDAAVNTFRVKYNCLPGDCASATRFGLGVDGNGDGTLIGMSPDYVFTEYNGFWAHLRAANLVVEPMKTLTVGGGLAPSIDCPEVALSTASGPAGGRACWVVIPGATDYISPSYLLPVRGRPNYYWISASVLADYNSESLTPLDSFSIDTKLDDGNPYTGNVFAAGPAVDPTLLGMDGPSEGFTGENVCVLTDVNPPTYNVSNTSRTYDWGPYEGALCSLLIRTGW